MELNAKGSYNCWKRQANLWKKNLYKSVKCKDEDANSRLGKPINYRLLAFGKMLLEYLKNNNNNL